MNFKLDKKKLINFLFLLAILLIGANLLIPKVMEKKLYKQKDISGENINKIFLNSVFDFGIKSDWIKAKKNTDKSSDSLIYKYTINVPRDLPISEIIQEIYNNFYPDNLRIVCHEKTIGGANSLSIFLNDKLRLKSIFQYNNDIKRNAGNIALIISNLEALDKSNISKIILSPEAFTAALLPSKKDTELADSLYSNRKQYAVLINDDINEMDFKLKSNFPQNRLGNAISAIIGAYPKSLFFLVDDNSRIYKSKSFPFIKKQLDIRGIKIVLTSSILKLTNTKDANKITILAHKTDDGSQISIEISSEKYLSLKPEIYGLIKVGYKFVTPIF